MKRLSAVAMALLFLLTSCTSSAYPTDDGYHFTTDSQYTWNKQGEPNIFACSENGYYFFAGGFLYYCDDERMESLAVCSKPNCLHSRETDSAKREMCNAYFNLTNYYGAQVYWTDGKIYVYAPYGENRGKGALYEVASDGSSRKAILTDLPVYQTMPDCALLHRGVFYVGDTQYDENMINHDCIRAYTLSDGKNKILYESEGEGASYLTNFRAEGNELYFWRYDPNSLPGESSYAAYTVNLRSDTVREEERTQGLSSRGILRQVGERSYRLAHTDAEDARPFCKLEVLDKEENLIFTQDFGLELKGIRGMYLGPRGRAFLVNLTQKTVNGESQIVTEYYYFDLTEVDTGHIELKVFLENIP